MTDHAARLREDADKPFRTAETRAVERAAAAHIEELEHELADYREMAAAAHIEELERIERVHQATLVRLRSLYGDDFVNDTLIAAHALVNQIHPEQHGGAS